MSRINIRKWYLPYPGTAAEEESCSPAARYVWNSRKVRDAYKYLSVGTSCETCKYVHIDARRCTVYTSNVLFARDNVVYIQRDRNVSHTSYVNRRRREGVREMHVVYVVRMIWGNRFPFYRKRGTRMPRILFKYSDGPHPSRKYARENCAIFRIVEIIIYC